MNKPSSERLPYDQRLARRYVPVLARLGLHPNVMTAFTLLLALAGCALLAIADQTSQAWGAGLFILARFLDHFDGELARFTGKTSRFGYYFDYVSGALSYAALFLALGWAFQEGWAGGWALVLGLAGAVAALAAMPLNLRLDEKLKLQEGAAVGYPALAGFELEDGIYLLGPVTWLGWLEPFFLAASVGALVYGIWTLAQNLRHA